MWEPRLPHSKLRPSPLVMVLTLATCLLVLVLHYHWASTEEERPQRPLALLSNMRPSSCSAAPSQRVHLRHNVTALVFAHNHSACFDRLPTWAIRMLQGNTLNHWLPQLWPNNHTAPLISRLVLCTQVGFDGKHTLWQCQGNPEYMPSITAFADMFIYCEGWDRPDDEYIHQGACVLNYEPRLRLLQPGAPVQGIAVGWVV